MPAVQKPESAPVWLELVAADPAAAAAFYGAVLGTVLGEPHGGMRTFEHPDGTIGLLVPAQPGDATGWLVYLLASDVDDSVRGATAAGGEVLVPVTSASPAGRYAVLRDPSGARVGLFEPELLAGVEVEGRPGAPGWYELHATSGYDEAVRFYADGLDWSVHVLSDSDGFRMVTYGQGDTAVAGIYDASASEAGRPSAWQVYFQVADVEAALTAVREHGGTVLDGPSDTPYGRMAHVLDPEGAPIALFVPPIG
jgi:predicted enzyme related to lactoylglutathione lyase